MSEQPTDPARELAVVLHDLAWLLPRTLDAQVTSPPQPLPPSELEIMRLLVRRPGLTVGEVARELALQATNVSSSLRALLARGLLERRRDESDGRVARLHPTAQAIANHEARERAWGDALESRLAGLPRTDADRMLRSAQPLRLLADALADGAAGDGRPGTRTPRV
jgi:DNA-binding MarR family transcriptional regulator